MNKTLTSNFKQSERLFPLLFVIGISIILVFLWAEGDPVPLEQKIYSTILGVISTVPMIGFLLVRSKGSIPYMALNCFFYFVAFSVNGFYFFRSDNQTLNSVPQSGWIAGLQIGIIGVLSQMAGYYFTRTLLASRKPIRVIGEMNNSRIRIMGWSLLICRYLCYAIPNTLEVSSIMLFLSVSSYVGFGLLAMDSVTKRMQPFERNLLFFVALPVEILCRLSTGAVYDPVLMLLFIFLVRWITTSRINWLVVILGISVFAIFNPIKSQYREIVWKSHAGQAMATTERVSLFADLAVEYWSSSHIQSQDVRSNLLTRLNHLVLASNVCNATPNSVPYWNGETLASAIYTLIPRVIWPDKPVLGYGVQFGQRYGITDPSDMLTTVNLTWVTELYANFGYFAVISGMSLIGAAFATMERWFGTAGTSSVDSIIPLATTFPLIYPESNIVMMWGGVISFTVVFYLLAMLFKK